MHCINYTITYVAAGSPDLYHAVRAGFINQGTSLNKWCIANGFNRQTVDRALRGDRRSSLCQELVQRLIHESGVVVSGASR